MYEIEFSKEAAKHVLLLRKSSPQLFKKLERLSNGFDDEGLIDRRKLWL